jgi:hypothetical protein
MLNNADMFNATVIRAFEDAGASVRLPPHQPGEGGPSRWQPDFVVEVQVGDRTARFAVELKSAAPYPMQISALDHLRDRLRRWGDPLLYAPRVTDGQGRSLTGNGWSWVDERGNFDLRAEGLVLRNRIPKARGEGRRSSAPLPNGWAGLRVVRTLITSPPDPIRTSTLARVAGISEPRTSQVLHQLKVHGFASKGPSSEWDVDRATLLNLFLGEYPGPGGDQWWFYALDPGAASRAVAQRQELEPVISGDVAADLLAPRRRPSHLIVYVRQGSLAGNHELVATTAQADANVILIRPRDTSVFPSEPSQPPTLAGVRLAEPTQIAWDLQQLGGADRLEQLEELKAWIIRRSH